MGYEFGGFDNRFGVLLLGVMPSCDAHRVSGTAVQRGLPPIAPDCCRAVPGHAANCYNLSREEQNFTLLVTASNLMQFVIDGAGRARTSFVPVANTSSFIGCHWAAVMPDTH